MAVVLTSTLVIRGAPDAKSTGSISASSRRIRLPNEVGVKSDKVKVEVEVRAFIGVEVLVRVHWSI